MARVTVFLVIILILTSTFPAFSQGWNVDMTAWLYNHWYSTYTVEIQGDYAYVITETGLSIIDISIPNLPDEVGVCFLEYQHQYSSLAVSGNYAYTGSGFGDLKVIDVSNPNNPYEVSSCILNWGISSISISGSIACVGTTSEKFYTMDISNPTIPIVMDSLDLDNDVYDVEISGNYAYLALYGISYSDGLRVIDISNPEDPVEVSYLHLGNARAVTIVGNYALVHTGQILFVIDISDPTNPIEYSNLHISSGVCDLATSGQYAYLGSYYTFQILDISNLANLELVSSTNIPSFGLAVSGNYIFAGGGSEGFLTINVSIPTTPRVVASYHPTNGMFGYFCDVAVSREHVFIANAGMGWYIVNVADPSNPYEVGHYSSPDTLCPVYKVAVWGDYLLIGDNSGTLTVMDVSDLSNPVEVGSIDLAYVLDIAVSGNFAYITDHFGLAVIDLVDPTNPTQVGTYLLQSDCSAGVAVSGNIACLGSQQGLRIIDVTDPTNPTEIAVNNQGGSIDDVAISGNYAYARSSDVNIYDITNPYSPELIANYETDIGVNVIKTAGDFMYLTLGDLLTAAVGLQVVSIEDPYHPVQFGYYDTPGTGNSVIPSGPYAYVADGFLFEIFDCSDALPVKENSALQMPEEFSLHQSYPNPFNASTVLTYTIPQQGRITLTIYNLLGQQVTTLFNDTQQPGVHSINWNATDFSSGIYFARLQSSNNIKTIKMVLMK